MPPSNHHCLATPPVRNLQSRSRKYCRYECLIKNASIPLVLRPSIINPSLWYPERPRKSLWGQIRREVLTRDDYSCRFCGHKAVKYMNVHHIEESGNNDPSNLATACVACHAVMHLGRNLSLGSIEIWKSDIPQVDLVRTTRSLVSSGLHLKVIKKQFKLKRGPYRAGSVDYANDLLMKMGARSRAYLPEPLCAVFVKFKRWQIETGEDSCVSEMRSPSN
jgi:hypothetical protein